MSLVNYNGWYCENYHANYHANYRQDNCYIPRRQFIMRKKKPSMKISMIKRYVNNKKCKGARIKACIKNKYLNDKPFITICE